MTEDAQSDRKEDQDRQVFPQAVRPSCPSALTAIIRYHCQSAKPQSATPREFKQYKVKIQ